MNQVDHDGIEEMAEEIASLDADDAAGDQRENQRSQWGEGGRQAARTHYRDTKVLLLSNTRRTYVWWTIFWASMSVTFYVLYLGGQFPDMLPPSVASDEEGVVYAYVSAGGVLAGFCALRAVKALRTGRKEMQRTLDRLALQLGWPI